MFGMLIAYDADGNVIATRDYQVIYDPDTLEPLGIADYLTHELNGGDNTEFWKIETFDTVVDKKGVETHVLRNPQPVKGSKVWPEWLGGRAHEFRVELDGTPGQKRITGLVHKKSGHRRERAVVEAAITDRIERAKGDPADIRDLVGGPDRPLLLDENGKTKKREKLERPNLPIVATSRRPG